MSNIKVIVNSKKVEDKREYENFEKFISDVRFWFSSGLPTTHTGSDEFLFIQVKEKLEEINSDGCKITVPRSGLLFTFVYDKFYEN